MQKGADVRQVTQYLTVSEAAAFLGVSPWTLRNWDKAGKLKPARHPQSGYRIYLRQDLEAAIKPRSPAPAPNASSAPRINWKQLGQREHFVQFYESDGFLIETVGAFIAFALEEGDAGVVIATDAHRDGIERQLKQQGVDLSRGAYVGLDAADFLSRFMVGESPDPRKFEEVVGGLIARLARKNRRVHAFGEMVALLWAQGNHSGAIRLEQLWNELAKAHPFSLFCAYPIDFVRGAEGDAAFSNICANHSHVLPAESYTQLPSPNQRLREIAVLQQKARSLEAQVTLRKEMEKTLELREHELRDLLENTIEGIHQMGPDGKIHWANKAELEMLGYARDEYIGHAIHEFHVDAEATTDIWCRLLRGERLSNYPARLRCKNGSVKHVLLHANARIEDGKFLYARCFLRDIGDEERARSRLAAIVESSDDAIISKTLDGTVISWNEAAQRLFGYSAQEMIGQSITKLFPPERIDEEQEILSRLSRGERIEHFETVRTRKDGTPIDVSVTVSPLRDRLGKIIGASKIARDTSARRRHDEELRKAKAAAEEASRVKDRFLAILSHELRTPLTPVLMSLAAMEMERDLPLRVQEDLAMIRRNIALETRLIDDLLDLSRVTNGKLVLRKEVISVHTLIRNVVQMCDGEAREAAIEVELDLQASHECVQGDPARLNQVLWNLLKNAIKFTPRQGRITLPTRNNALNCLTIEIIDTGIGIEPQALRKIFNAFEQGDAAVGRQYGGLGLGLAISKSIVEMHGGRIAAHSEGRGRGAVFTVELGTVSSAERCGSGSSGASYMKAGDPKPVRILLVDDHADTLKVMRRLLESFGHRVEVAGTVLEAARAAGRNRFDLLISDIGLPDGTGLDVIKAVRAKHPGLPGIALTGFGMEQDLRTSLNGGFAAHLTKPVDLACLEGTIRQLTRPDGAKIPGQ